VGTRCANHVTPLYPQKLALTSPSGGGRSVGMVRSRTKATEFSFRYQLKIITAIFTGHAPVRGHLYVMGPFDGDPICRFCGIFQSPFLCCCEALSRQRYNVFRRLTVEPKDISTASVRDLCLFIRGCAEWSI